MRTAFKTERMLERKKRVCEKLMVFGQRLLVAVKDLFEKPGNNQTNKNPSKAMKERDAGWGRFKSPTAHCHRKC